MALRRKKIKNSEGNFITKPVRCGICKENRTIFTIHGGFSGHGGKTCCDNCYEKIKKNSEKNNTYNNDLSEAEYQINRNLFGD